MYIEDYHNETRNETSILLAGYFGVHMRGKGTECSKVINGADGIYLIEAMKYAIDNVNKNNNALFGIKLGYRIYDTCTSVKTFRKQIRSVADNLKFVGVVGPPTSNEAMLAAMVFGAYGMSVISYSATSVELNDREKYEYLYRTLPSDDLQVRALLAVLKHYKWKYISTVNSHGNYGQRGMDLLISKLRKEGICVSKRNVLPKKPTKKDLDFVVRNLNWDLNARIVVLFTTIEDTNVLLKAAGPKSRLQWLSSSSWTANMQTVQGVKEAAKGAILLNYRNINNKKFLEHFKTLTPKTDSYGWLKEFWEQQFNCSIRQKVNSTKKLCIGNESLKESDFYAKYAAAGAVIDAVHAFTHAIRCSMMKTNKSAQEMREIFKSKPTEWADLVTMKLQLPPLSCKDPYNHAILFEADNTYQRDIEILNFDGATYNSIGVWEEKLILKRNRPEFNYTLQMSNKSVVWYNGLNKIPESICSKPCGIGERKSISKFKECCFICQACKSTEILRDNLCVPCKKFSKPNQNKTKCEKLGKVQITVKHPMSVIILFESMLGFIFNSIVLLLFIKYKDSRIVKASSRELSLFMLGGLYLCFISPCVFLLDPTKVRCGLRRFIFGISLTACYTPLMLKTNRIYRLFKAARVMASMPQLVSPGSQIVMCFGLLALQLLLCIMWVVGDKPVVTQLVVHDGNNVADLCGANIITVIVNIIPCFCMMAVSTVYAFKSRKFPKNYNEASSIGVTMYISSVLWAIFIPLLLLVEAKSPSPFTKTFVIANFTNVIGLVTLAGLFGPKIYRLMTFNEEEASNFQKCFSNAYRSKDGSGDDSPHENKKLEDLNKNGRDIKNESMKTVNAEV